MSGILLPLRSSSSRQSTRRVLATQLGCISICMYKAPGNKILLMRPHLAIKKSWKTILLFRKSSKISPKQLETLKTFQKESFFETVVCTDQSVGWRYESVGWRCESGCAGFYVSNHTLVSRQTCVFSSQSSFRSVSRCFKTFRKLFFKHNCLKPLFFRIVIRENSKDPNQKNYNRQKGTLSPILDFHEHSERLVYWETCWSVFDTSAGRNVKSGSKGIGTLQRFWVPLEYAPNAET